MFHWILTRVCGWDRRVFFTSVPDVCFAHYYDERGRVRWTRKLH
jgi:hypothetical protein